MKYKWGAAALLALIACKKEKKDADSDVGHSAVTTLEVVLVHGQDTVRGRYKDPDGPGGRPAVIDTLRPAANTRYTFSIRLYDESGNPVKDLTPVIFEQQKNTHTLFLLPDPPALAEIQVEDRDDLGRPVGGRGTWTQGPDSLRTGVVRFLLRHYLNPNDKNFGLERGATDLDVSLPVQVP